MSVPDVSDRSLTDLLSLDGKVAVVTGAAVGIGLAVARRLAEAGASVVVADLHDTDEAVASIVRDTHHRVVGTHLDVADPESIVACANLAIDELGGLDIWVNNAGIYPSAPLLDLTNDAWDWVLDVNLRGSFIGAREAASRMIAAGHGGVIVNIASTAGYQAAGPGVAHYVSSKHAVLGLTKSLAVELGPHGIRALAVSPTLIETPGIEAGREAFRAAGMGDMIDTYAQRLPLGRVGVADDVARAVLFAASDLAVFMTGSSLLVDGGDVAV
ncbi:MAG: SDR family NAD(P)-dependent oxidoreductase [Acidimicrobiales bacterium]